MPTFLTKKGRALVDSIDTPLADVHRRHAAQLTPEQLKTLLELLELYGPAR